MERSVYGRDGTRLTRFIHTAICGLSSGTSSCGGEAGRFLGGGDGERCLKKVRIVLFFLLFFGAGLAAFAGAKSTGISSSVDGGEESEESESPMFVVVWVVGRG